MHQILGALFPQRKSSGVTKLEVTRNQSGIHLQEKASADVSQSEKLFTVISDGNIGLHIIVFDRKKSVCICEIAQFHLKMQFVAGLMVKNKIQFHASTKVCTENTESQS